MRLISNWIAKLAAGYLQSRVTSVVVSHQSLSEDLLISGGWISGENWHINFPPASRLQKRTTEKS